MRSLTRRIFLYCSEILSVAVQVRIQEVFSAVTVCDVHAVDMVK